MLTWKKTVLGAMLLSSEAFAIGLKLEPSDFCLESNRRIFGRMVAKHAAGTAVDSSTLTSEFRRPGELDSVGGIGYVMHLFDGVPYKFNPDVYAKILHQHATRRKIVNLRTLMQSCAEGGEDPETILAELSAGALQSQWLRARSVRFTLENTLFRAFRDAKAARWPRGMVLGISSGIRELDTCTTGWREGELTCVGALPGRGKTSFLLQAMYEAAAPGVAVACISLEMRASHLVRRLTIIHSGLAAQSLRDARNLTPENYTMPRSPCLRWAIFPSPSPSQTLAASTLERLQARPGRCTKMVPALFSWTSFKSPARTGRNAGRLSIGFGMQIDCEQLCEQFMALS
jgi:replicative DNA helicase